MKRSMLLSCALLTLKASSIEQPPQEAFGKLSITGEISSPTSMPTSSSQQLDPLSMATSLCVEKNKKIASNIVKTIDAMITNNGRRNKDHTLSVDETHSLEIIKIFIEETASAPYLTEEQQQRRAAISTEKSLFQLEILDATRCFLRNRLGFFGELIAAKKITDHQYDSLLTNTLAFSTLIRSSAPQITALIKELKQKEAAN